MLKRLGGTVDPKGAATAIKDAEFPVPFASELEFNSPVHGTWNIVHTGMQVPDAHQIYVCADNCMRGVVLTAAEMNEAERFSFVILKEEHLLNGNLEDITIEGVADVIEIIFWAAILRESTMNWENGFLKSVLSDVLWIRSCERAV